MRKLSALLLLTISLTVTQYASASDYSGQQTREIKSLSADDIDDLLNGRGWGLAKSAELNGLPGPAHLLEYKEDLRLSASQVQNISDLYLKMHLRAKKLGKEYIEQEQFLEHLIQSPDITQEQLDSELKKSALILADLRFTHLSAHLKTPDVLTKEQIERYNSLRGYGASDLCENPPEGHDPDMWKKHNNCS
ncbi:MAG: hypothetical protein GKR96_08095 [Gammaproteobacteria bacterium]|nr:hypothetical protein [Gammaproteobacteria bacterium]